VVDPMHGHRGRQILQHLLIITSGTTWRHWRIKLKVDSRAALRDRIFAAAEHTTILIKFIIYNFYLVIEVPDHVYVLVISSWISDCCISIFRFSWCFRIPRPHMCIRSECQVLRCDDVTRLWVKFVMDRPYPRHIHVNIASATQFWCVPKTA